MELLFVAVLAASFGLGARYTIPGRDRYGAALLPALACSAGMLVWVVLLWLGLTFDGGWIWLLSLLAAAAIAIAGALLLPRLRQAADTRLRSELGI